jgi:hypothetical protein
MIAEQMRLRTSRCGSAVARTTDCAVARRLPPRATVGLRQLAYCGAIAMASIASIPLCAQVSATVTAQDAAAWREDLHALARELPQRHKDGLAHLSRDEWDAAVNRLDARIPQLQRHQIVVELMRLVALVGDGHTALWPDLQSEIGFRRLPIELYDFSDGLFIVTADSAHRDLAGLRVLRIGRVPARDALDSAARIVSHESPQWARYRGPSYLVIPEVLAGLGITDDPERATFVVEENGRERSVTLAATRAATGHIDPDGPRPGGWRDMRESAPGPDPLWQQRPDVPFWFSILPDRTLYICHRAVLFSVKGETNEAFFRRAFAAGDSARVARVVLDIRSNGGGDNSLNRFVVREIIRRPDLDRPDRLFVLIGRRVFSAAQNLVNELDFYTSATFVGEPTGNAPNQYGDPRPFELPRSHLRVLISSLLWEGHSASDTRNWYPPAVYAEASSADYRSKADPVLAAALRRASQPAFADLVRQAADRGDTNGLRRDIEAYQANPENRFRPAESVVNRLGYDMLSAANTNGAIAVFQANAMVFARSANVFDSLGEALERAGKRDAAVTAYRQALALDAKLASSRDALQRLGASP